MANLDEFNLQLSGELDQQQSKKNINDDIATLERAIEHLKVQAEIDPNSVKNIAKQLSDILNQKIVVDNIQIDTAKATKTAQQLGQKIGDTVEKSVQQSLSIDDVIDKQVTDLMAKYSIAGKKGSKAFEEIRQAVVNYRKELASIDSAFDSDDIFDIFSNSADIRKVTSALTDHMKVADATKDTYASLAEYIKHVNNSGTKIHLPESIRQEYGDDFSSMRSQLGKAFTTGQGGDFESFITELNGDLGNVIDMSQGAEAAFGDLVQKVNSAKGGNFLSGDELFKQGYLDRNEIEKNITSAINIIDEEEKKLAQTSTVVANTVVQNEQKKQQAYQQTAKAQSSVDNPDLDMSGNAQKIEQFKESLEELGTVDSKYVDRLSERFENLGIQIQTINASLSEVAVREKGEYKGTKEILSSTLTGIDKYGQAITLTEAWNLTNHEFVKSLDAVGSSFDNVQKHVTTYQAKLNDLKTKYSNASLDYSGFETTLANFQKGIGTVDDLKLAFNELENSAKLGVQSLKSQSSSFDPIQQALNNMRDMPSMLKTLEASMSGVKDKTSLTGISVKDLTSKYEELQKEMTANGGKVPLTDQWTQDYRELMSTVTSATKQVDALKKAEASDNSQATKQANYYSSILASYRQMYDIKKKLLSAGEEEAKVLESQRKSLSASIASNYKQLGNQGLTDKDWQSQVDALKKEQEYQLSLTQARISDKNAIQEQTQAQRDYVNALREQEALQKNLDKIQLSTDLTKLTTDYQKFGVVSQEVENNLKELKLAQEAVVNAKGTDRLASEIDKYNTKLTETKSSLKELTTTQVSMNQRTSQMTSMQEWMRKNKNATKLVGDQVNKLIEECKTCDAVRFNGIKNEFKELQVQAGKAGKLGSGTLEGLIEQGKKFVQWIGVTGTVMRGIQISRDMIQNVKDLDDSLLELSKVSDLSASGLEKVTEQAYELGEKVARTGKEVIDATTEFKRAGFDMQQSMDMAESAMVMTNVAENITDTADAAGTLISVLKGFNMDASETMTIVDKINQVSNTSPIGFDNIAEGLERTAGTMAQSGNTIDQTIGLITAGYAQLRNVEKVSTGLITLSARLRGVGEDGEVIDGLSSKLQEDFGKIGVAIENADGSLRSIYEIAQDYSKVLPTLSDKQKQYYAELAAGKRQVTVWNAITQQFQDAEYAVNQSINSQNSALDENQKKLDSIGGHVKSFESAMEHLSSTVIESDLIKFFVDLGTTGVKAIDGLVNALSPLGTAALIGGGILGGKNLGEVCKCTFSNCFEYALYA